MADSEHDLFPSQFIATPPATEYRADLGAPFGPVPRSFATVPRALRCCEPLAATQELQEVLAMRGRFRVGDYPDPYLDDILRTFRLIAGSHGYLEIGTFDRGNLAYVSGLLADDAIIIGLDVQDEPQRDSKLRDVLKPGQTYVPVVGDSRDPAVVARVGQILGDRQLDTLFIDGNHTAHAVLCDYANYEGFVRDDGIIMLHDSVWEGDQQYKGVADMLAEINTVDPVYLVDGTNPPRRFMRPMWKDQFWGVVAVVFAHDQLWRRRSGG